MFVLVGTALQMALSLREVATTRRAALEHKNAEDELVAERPRLKRRGARRDLISDRELEVRRAICEACVACRPLGVAVRGSCHCHIELG